MALPEEIQREIEERLETQRVSGYQPVMVRMPDRSEGCRLCKTTKGEFGVSMVGEQVEEPEKCFVWALVTVCGTCAKDEKKRDQLIQEMLKLPRGPVKHELPDPDAVRASPSGQPVIGYAQIMLHVWYTGDPTNPTGEVAVEATPNLPFPYWMIGCEHFIRATAQKSHAGYEEAIDLLVKGALQSRGKFTKPE